MKNKSKGLVAGLAAAAVLAGGSTFALWSDSVTSDAGSITAGNLDIALVGAPAWQDISADRTDAPHAIDLSTFKIAPGDTIEGTFAVDGALEGDNVVAALAMETAGAPSGALLNATDGVTVTYSLYKQGSATPIAGATDVALGTSATVNFASLDNSANTGGGALNTMPAVLDGTADYNVVVKATFASSTPDQVRVQAAADLNDLVASLTQTRTAGAGGGF